MTTYTLETYMCKQRYDAIDVEQLSNDGEVSVNDADAILNAYIGNQVVLLCGQSKIIGYLGKENSISLETKDPPPCDCSGNFTINYPVSYYYYPSITVGIPDDCHWVYSTVMLWGPARCNPAMCFFRSTSSSTGGAMPQPDDYDNPGDFDPKVGAGGGGGGSSTQDVTQNYIVPGELVYAYQFHRIDGSHKKVTCGREFWQVPWVTGGIVYSITGSLADPGCLFSVSVEDELIDCTRTDWVEWEVGDWVFVLKDKNTTGPASWSDFTIHKSYNATGDYDYNTHPPEPTTSALNETIIIEFGFYPGTFTVEGSISGAIGSGTTGADFTCSQFVLRAAGWNGGTWARFDSVRFKTQAAPSIGIIMPLKVGVDGA